jgi:hypothetical protein
LNRLKHTVFAMAALAFSGAGAMAQEPPKLVEVKGVRDPQMQAYRSAWAGLDAFDKYRHLAPQAGPLQFRIRPRDDNQNGTIKGITLAIVGNGDPLPVAIAADGLFRIERNQRAYDDKADLIFNHKRHLFTAYAEIRTPGLAANVRRVGDLRLECQVNAAIVKTEIPFYFHAMANAVFGGGDWCAKVGIYRSVRLKELRRATLVHGARRQDFTLADMEAANKIPEPEWPDEALLELEFADAAPTP